MPSTRRTVRRTPSLPEATPELPSHLTPLIAEKVKEKEDFGRDQDIKNLLKTLQPKTFSLEGPDVPKDLEEWIMSMEDYFDLAKYNALAQGIMGRAKLDGAAKLWWKLSCQTRGAAENAHGWEILKELL